MTEQDCLLRAILDNPHDDLPRLVYADRLEETGRRHNIARAEFVRLQIEREQQKRGEFPASPENDRRQDFIDRRVRSLLKTWGMKWLPQTARRVAGSGPSRTSVAFTSVAVDAGGTDHFVFGRGFVEQVEVVVPSPAFGPPRKFGEYCRNALAAHPVERVVFYVTYHAPGLVFGFGTAQYPAGHWACWVREDSDDGERPRWSLVCPDRRTLLAGLPKFVEETFAEVDFERVRGDGFETEAEEDADVDILEYGPDFDGDYPYH